MSNASRTTISTFAAIMGLAGIEHGIGEVLQGDVAPESIVILSWPTAPFFRNVAGEPAMTVIPNLLITGILAILFSLAYLLWALLFIDRRGGAVVLILLAIAMLLFGGGLFPPILGIGLGIAAAKINAPPIRWRSHALSQVWGWSFVVSLAAWFFLMPGLNILAYYFGVDNASLTIITIIIALACLLLTIFSALARDVEKRAAISQWV